MCAFCVGEPLISADVAHHDGLPSPAGLDHGMTKTLHAASTGQRRDAARVRLSDDELAAVDLCVMDPARLEMLTNKADRDLLDRDRVLEGTQSLVQCDEKVPLGRHAMKATV